MATQRKGSQSESGRPADGNSLESLLNGVQDFVVQIINAATEAAGESDQRLLIASTGESMIAQTVKVTSYIRESADRLAPVQRLELNRFLRFQDVEAQAQRVAGVAQQFLKGGIIGKILHWIAQHFIEIKKILEAILQFIFKLLHLPYPEWLDTLFRILDELINLILSLLGDVFGIEFRVTARELSELEVNFLRESAAFEAVRVARAGGRAAAQEE